MSKTDNKDQNHISQDNTDKDEKINRENKIEKEKTKTSGKEANQLKVDENKPKENNKEKQLKKKTIREEKTQLLPILRNIEEELVKVLIIDRETFLEFRSDIDRSFFKDSQVAYELFTIIASDIGIPIAGIKDTIINHPAHEEAFKKEAILFLEKLEHIDDHDALKENIEFNINTLKKRKYMGALSDLFTKGLDLIKKDLKNFASSSYENSRSVMLKTFSALNTSTYLEVIESSDLREELFEELEEENNHDIFNKKNVTTHWTGLNNLYRQFKKGHLVIIAARPSVGKTTFVLNLLYQNSLYKKLNCLFVSLEMGNVELMYKLAKIFNFEVFGNSDHDSNEKFITSIESITNNRIFLAKTNVVTPDDIKSIALRIMSKSKLDYLIIDYLQLMKNSNSKYKSNSSRYEEVTNISRSLKLLAKELDIPIIALCQLNREVEKRKEGYNRPFLWDLKDSGSIEQDADIVLLLHRIHNDEENLNNVENAKEEVDFDDIQDINKRKLKLFVEKNRHGETGELDFEFRVKEGVFRELRQSFRNY